MFRLLLIGPVTLVAASEAAYEGKRYGEIEYTAGDGLNGNHLVFEKCNTLDMKGLFHGDYTMKYTGVSMGYVLLYKGPNTRNCDGKEDRFINFGKSLALNESDGKYWGVKYSANCFK